MWLRSLTTRWQSFWWGPIDARIPALLRVAFAAVAIGVHLTWWPEVGELLDAAGQPRNIVAPTTGRGFSLFCIPAVTGWVAHAVHAATLVPLVGLLVGVGGRFTALLAWLVVLGWYQRAPGTSSGGDRLLRFGLLYLTTGASCACWSVDAWWRRRRGRPTHTTVPGLPVRLVQVQWAAMYFLSGLEKAGGASWQKGTALHYALSNRTFARFGSFFHPILESPFATPILKGATWGVLGWELMFPLMVLWRPSRIPALVMGLLVHFGIGLTMSVGPFTLVTVAGYVAFLSPRPRSGPVPSSAPGPPEPS